MEKFYIFIKIYTDYGVEKYLNRLNNKPFDELKDYDTVLLICRGHTNNTKYGENYDDLGPVIGIGLKHKKQIDVIAVNEDFSGKIRKCIYNSKGPCKYVHPWPPQPRKMQIKLNNDWELLDSQVLMEYLNYIKNLD